MALRCFCSLAPWQQQNQFPARRSCLVAPKQSKVGLQCQQQLFSVHRRISVANAVTKPHKPVINSDEDEELFEDEEQHSETVASDETLTEDDTETDEEDEGEEVDVDTLSNEEIDALMKEYGDVVRSDPEPTRTPIANDDAAADAEGLALALALAKVANESKAVDIKVLHVKPLVYWTRYFIVASVFSMPQANAISGKMEDLAEEKFKTTNRGSTKPSAWTLLDFGDVIVHMFLPAEREHYDIEEFYANAPLVDLPFETTEASSVNNF